MIVRRFVNSNQDSLYLFFLFVLAGVIGNVCVSMCFVCVCEGKRRGLESEKGSVCVCVLEEERENERERETERDQQRMSLCVQERVRER